MSCSSDKGQTEPVAALFAVLVVGAGLALYADVLDETLDAESERDVASPTLERVESHLTSGGVVDPARMASIDRVTPAGYEANVTLVTEGRRWSTGPTPVNDTRAASRTVSVRSGAASIEAGRLRVVIWS